MSPAMIQASRIDEYLQRLTPVARGSLLTELERLEVCGAELPGTAELLQKLRAESRKSGQTSPRVTNPSRYFFAPLEPLLVDGVPDRANTGRILRGSLAPIWQWVSRDLLPMMARDYVNALSPLIAADNQRQIRQVVATFQTKVVKYLENTLDSPVGADQTRTKLATYTASNAAFGDLTRMLCVLRARDALAKLDSELPAAIEKFDNKTVFEITALLDAFRRNHPDALAFALTLVAKRLETPWQLIRLATKAARSKSAADIAATPCAIAVSMVLDLLDDQRLALRVALKKNRVQAAKEILASLYDSEYALQVRINGLDQSDWGERLRQLMDAVAALVESEVSRFPEKVGHVLGSRRLRRHQSLGGRLTYLVWKARDTLSGSAALCKNLIIQPEEPRAWQSGFRLPTGE
jgi:hypothetical protein